MACRMGPNINPYGNKAWPLHDQEEPLICVIFDVKPMTETIFKMYDQGDSSSDNLIDKQLLKMNQEASDRKNFTQFFEDNFKQILYIEN